MSSLIEVLFELQFLAVFDEFFKKFVCSCFLALKSL